MAIIVVVLAGQVATTQTVFTWAMTMGLRMPSMSLRMNHHTQNGKKTTAMKSARHDRLSSDEANVVRLYARV